MTRRAGAKPVVLPPVVEQSTSKFTAYDENTFISPSVKGLGSEGLL